MTTKVQAMTDDEARAIGARLAALRVHRRGMTAALSEPDADTGFPAGKRGVISTVSADGESAFVRWDDGSLDDCDYLTRYLLPDLRDAATRGAALDVVRERYNDPTIYIEIGFTGPDTPPNAWLRSGAGHDAPYANESTEAEALVAALEAA